MSIRDDLLKVYHGNTENVDLGTQHQWRCKDCGEEGEPADHWGYCTDKNFCQGCQMSVQIADEKLDHDLKYVDRGRTHRQECTRCDYVTEEEEHSAFCDVRHTCRFCNSVIPRADEDHLWHRGEHIDWKITETTCEEYCKHCGYSWGVYEHIAVCTDTTVCCYCGNSFTIVDENDIGHLAMDCQWRITETTCQEYCTACASIRWSICIRRRSKM